MLEVRAEVNQEWGIFLKRFDQVITVTASDDSRYVSSNLANCRSVSASMRSRKEHNPVRRLAYGTESTIQMRCQ